MCIIHFTTVYSVISTNITITSSYYMIYIMYNIIQHLYNKVNQMQYNIAITFRIFMLELKATTLSFSEEALHSSVCGSCVIFRSVIMDHVQHLITKAD